MPSDRGHVSAPGPLWNFMFLTSLWGEGQKTWKNVSSPYGEYFGHPRDRLSAPQVHFLSKSLIVRLRTRVILLTTMEIDVPHIPEMRDIKEKKCTQTLHVYFFFEYSNLALSRFFTLISPSSLLTMPWICSTLFRHPIFHCWSKKAPSWSQKSPHHECTVICKP